MEEVGIELKNKDRNKLCDGGEHSNKNIFIEAGAGAGKTETIIDMIASQIYSGVSPERIVAITFTNKATEELISRVSSKLQEKIDSDEINNEKKQQLKAALKVIYKMNISTIHHFCNAILNENSYRAKLSYGFSLLEEQDEEKRRNDFYYKWFRSLNSVDRKELYNCRPDALSKLKSTFDSLCSQFDDIKIVKSIKFDLKAFYDSVLSIYNKLKEYEGTAMFGSYAEKFIYAWEPYLSHIANLFEFISLIEGPTSDELLSKIRTDLKLKKDKKYTITKDEIDYINENELNPLALQCKELKDLYISYSDLKGMNIVNEYAHKAWDSYKESRDKISLSNNQLIFETHKLITNNKDITQKIANKYDVIFVDEFQDTDKYQNKFIFELAKAIDERKFLECKDEAKITRSLVVVGDPKQSIYGFRGADFNLYMETCNNFTSSGIHNTLNVFFPENYRSNKYILDWVNDTYSSKDFYSGYTYKKMLLPKANELPEYKGEPNVLAGVYSYNFNGGNKFENLAHFIDELVKDHYKIYKKKDKDSNFELNDIKYSDFLVLTTSHSEINEYVKAFREKNIAASVAGEFDLCSSELFNLLYRVLLCVLENDYNNSKLINDSFNYSEDTANILVDFKEKTKEYSPYGKMLYVFNNIHLISSSFSDSDKKLLKTIIMQVTDNICFNKNASSIELLNEIDSLIHQTVESQLSLDPSENAVRIMNVHKAKGLTSEIVIIADSGGFNSGDSCKVLGDKIYLNNIKLYPSEKAASDNASKAEKLRLEYVACTRAKQVMVFESIISSGHLFKRNEEPYESLSNLSDYHIACELPRLASRKEKEDEIEKDASDEEISVSTSSVEVEKKDIYSITLNDLNAIDSSLLESNCIENSPSALENKTHLEPIEGLKYKRPQGNIFGTVFHRVMELYALHPKKSIEEQVERAMKENANDICTDLVEEYTKYLKECANAVISLYEKGNLLSNYSIIKPEFKFCDYSDTTYGDKPTVMNGSIDLLLLDERKKKAIIIDYKTDMNLFGSCSDFEKILKERYSSQLSTYKKVINNAISKGEFTTETYIVWLEESSSNTVAHMFNLKD